MNTYKIETNHVVTVTRKCNNGLCYKMSFSTNDLKKIEDLVLFYSDAMERAEKTNETWGIA